MSRYSVKALTPALKKLSELLKKIYVEHSEEEISSVLTQVLQILQDYNAMGGVSQETSSQSWDESTALLITYADGVSKEGEFTLRTLKKLVDNYLGDLASVIHILPFLSSTSDGGFAVSSFEEIEKRFGDWEDLKEISKNHFLMADLVLNHVSSSHPWVVEFMQSKDPGKSYILSPKIEDNWSNVVRPRNTALFTSLPTNKGYKNVWTTFGPDQIDVNWQDPKIIIEFLKLLVLYVRNGVKWIRLDAVGFIWKESGTPCIHNKEVHDLVRALRIQIKQLINNAVLVTETNVPEKENISYLISGDEANLAYNFTLPPLILESLLTNKADLINQWLCNWTDLPKETGFLNFTASHDGIGLRPLEGIMEINRVHELLIACEKRGGLVSHRRLSNGEDQPYELNISWWSAMADKGRDPSLWQFERFLLSQLFVMAIKGIPAFYLQALLASDNDLTSFSQSGERRDLNREKFQAKDLFLQLENPNSLPSRNLKALNKAMKIRGTLKAFHPEEDMTCMTKGRTDLVIIKRGKGDDSLWAVHNMTNSILSFSFNDDLQANIQKNFYWKDFLNNLVYLENRLELTPYSVHWFMQSRELK